jgi:hypothetical protein
MSAQSKKAVYDLLSQLGKFCLIDADLGGMTVSLVATHDWTRATSWAMIGAKLSGGIRDALG